MTCYSNTKKGCTSFTVQGVGQSRIPLILTQQLQRKVSISIWTCKRLVMMRNISPTQQRSTLTIRLTSTLSSMVMVCSRLFGKEFIWKVTGQVFKAVMSLSHVKCTKGPAGSLQW